MSSEAEFIAARQERYRLAHNSLDAETFASWIADSGTYTDHGLGVKDINREKLKELATSVYASVKDMVFTTVSVNGDRSFTAWEWTATGVLTKEVPGVGKKAGDTFDSLGVSLFWWVEGEDKIQNLVEYPKIL